jgi:uncharacterized membrane protein YphA (DoxX/SURF4 family)
MNLLKQSLAAESVSDVHAWGQLILRVAVGLMIFPVAGLLTRLNAALLAGALSVAMLQNVLAWRDPQLAVLYALIMAALIFIGGGRFSLDAMIMPQAAQSANHP